MDSQFETLIGYQKAEFSKAARYQYLVVLSELVLLILTCATFFIRDKWIFYSTVGSLLLAILWLFFWWKFTTTRRVSEKVRRATFFMGGMGFDLSDHEFREIRMQLSSKPQKAQREQDSSYYATKRSAGPERLVAMLEEVSFWSEHLLRASAFTYFVVILSAVLVLIISFIAFAPLAKPPFVMIGAKVLCALLAAFASIDFVGAACSYVTGASEVRNIQARVQLVKADPKQNLNELLVIIADYNSAVENAPLFAPGVYRKNRDRLNELWANTKAEKID